MDQVNNQTEQQRKIIFAECEVMLGEGIEIEKITGRKVAKRSDIEWSHTTVTPHVLSWREQIAIKEREAISQTQMSQNFVKALIREVDDRITSLRAVDVDEMNHLRAEIGDVLENNRRLEAQLDDLTKKLAEKTKEATESSALNSKYTDDISDLKLDIDNIQKTANERYERDTAELRSALEKAEKKHEAEIASLREQHTVEQEKLADKNEQLHKDLNAKTDECAQAKVKAERFDETEKSFRQAQDENIELNKQVHALQLDVESKLVTIESNQSQITDCIEQRNRAQTAQLKLEGDLKEVTDERNALKLVQASATVQEA